MYFRVPLGYGLCVYILTALVRTIYGGELYEKSCISYAHHVHYGDVRCSCLGTAC